MKFGKFDNGVAGLNLFLSVIVSLFVIGLIVMIFALMSGGLIEASYTPNSGTPTGEVLTNVNNNSATSFAAASLQDASCSGSVFYNQTGGETIASGNYTVSGCTVTATSDISQTFSATADALTGPVTNTTAVNNTVAGLPSVVCSGVSFYNLTGETISAGNYTIDGCSVTAANRERSTISTEGEVIANLTNVSVINFTSATYPEVVCSAVTVYNQSTATIILAGGNYTISGCSIIGNGSNAALFNTGLDNVYPWFVNYTSVYNTSSQYTGYPWFSNYTYVYPTSSEYSGTNWLVNYTYTFNADNDATHTMGNTSQAIASAIDWFDIFIVIAAMVVLILLTVIIIASIRGSGLITQSTA